MRRILLLALAFYYSASSFATHIVGGDLHYEYLGGDEYDIFLKVYRDCATSFTDFDNPAVVGIYNADNQLIATADILLSDAVITDLPVTVDDPCLQPPSDLCVKEAVYKYTITIPYEPGGFTLVYQRCCRNTTLVNCESNDDIGITLTTQIPDREIYGDNSNPNFNNFPPVAICINQPYVFDHSATDLDGDSLVYELCNPLLTNVPGFYINPPGPPEYPLLEFYPEYSYQYPIDSDPAFAIDQETGLLTGTPTAFGQFVIGICVSEYRNGELLSVTNRDFQFNIVACSESILALAEEEPPCQGLNIDFGNLSSDAESYWWDFGVETLESDTSTLFEPNYTFADTGTYEVMLIANPGFQCADTSYVTILAYEPIAANIELVNDFCQNGSRWFEFVSTESYTANADYFWEFDATADPPTSTDIDPENIGFDTPGTYTITLSVEDHHCEATASLEIVVDPMPQAGITPQSEFCTGLTIDFINTSQYSSNYLWDFGEPGSADQSTEENPTWTYSEYGTYTVTLTADPGSDCADTETIEVVILSPDPIELQYSITTPEPCDSALAVTVDWAGSGADYVEWNMGDGTILEGYPHNYIYDEPGQYTITISAEQELCDFEESADQEIYYDVSVIDREILIPNVFTPNNDGKNDRYRIFYVGESDELFPPGRDLFSYIDSYSMKIYDRWGVLLFDNASDGNAWDGSYNGDVVTEGAYYYIITYRRLCLDDAVQNRAGSLEVLNR